MTLGPLRVAAWLREYGLLAALYLVTGAALTGYATFRLRPELLSQSPGLLPAYSQAFTLAPRLQIVIAFLALAGFLVRYVGPRWIPAFFALNVISLASELAGTTVGLPFGPYRYTDGLGPKWLGHVPVLIPLSWFFMALPAYAIARGALRGGRARTPRDVISAREGRGPSPTSHGAVIGLASFILLAWDLSLDPAMSRATAYWVWGTAGAYYGMPLLNLVGWYVTGVALMAALVALRVDDWVHQLPLGWLVAFYGANLLLPLGMSAASGMWGVIAATAAALGLCWGVTRLARRADQAVQA